MHCVFPALTQVPLLPQFFSGRLDKLLYVPLPCPEDRASILKALAVKIKLGPDVNLEKIAASPHANGYSGADCAALLREAGLAVLKENLGAMEPPKQPLYIESRHFDYAFQHVLPSVSNKDQARYDRMRHRMARARTRAGGVDDTATANGAAPSTESVASGSIKEEHDDASNEKAPMDQSP